MCFHCIDSSVLTAFWVPVLNPRFIPSYQTATELFFVTCIQIQKFLAWDHALMPIVHIEIFRYPTRRHLWHMKMSVFSFSILSPKTCHSFAVSDTLTFRFVTISFSAIATDIGFTASEDRPDLKSSSRDWWPRVNSLNFVTVR